MGPLLILALPLGLPPLNVLYHLTLKTTFCHLLLHPLLGSSSPLIPVRSTSSGNPFRPHTPPFSLPS
jgi:hypothetical protein